MLKVKLKKYNSEKGFGFIALEEQADIFFHITDFPTAGGEPKVGELLKFLIVQDKDKFKAANIVRLDLKSSHPSSHFSSNSEISSNAILPNNAQSSSKKRMIVTVIGLMMIAVLAVLVFNKYQSYQQSQRLKTAQLIAEQKKIVQQQRDALGELPEIKLSQKTENALQASTSVPVMNNQSQQLTANQTQFKCDGRQHCSQMRSREEAEFFVRNCPNTKMDGDNDGEPCENDSRW
ncbi:excalibur calcium-binding domain-containing protein [Acinetobacter sp. WCHA29]|uniref:excalibur calcium-binding domain-containing protein n=1 Tax=Acinetobacter sp. WCHA29 TaxID=2004649 RepID=UPI000B3C2361|nr:excalibur calcium-binding domain-containing protein [Acinetobacter sp. WCHA29]